MKHCKQCECNLPNDYELDICTVCIDDMDGLIPDSMRPFDNRKYLPKVKRENGGE